MFAWLALGRSEKPDGTAARQKDKNFRYGDVPLEDSSAESDYHHKTYLGKNPSNWFFKERAQFDAAGKFIRYSGGGDLESDQSFIDGRFCWLSVLWCSQSGLESVILYQPI